MFFEVDVQYPKNLYNRHNDLPFSRLPTDLHDKEEYIIHIRNLKQALKHGIVLTKVNRLIKFNQNV